jgi:hypothetical protein
LPWMSQPIAPPMAAPAMVESKSVTAGAAYQGDTVVYRLDRLREANP